MANENIPDPAATEAWNKLMSKFNSVMGASTSALEANKKVLLSEQLAHQKLINDLMKEHGLRSDEAKQIAKQIKQEERELKVKEEGMALEKERQALQEKIDQERTEGAKKVARSLGDFAVGSVKAANSLYTADNAFSAVTPIVTLMGTSLTGAIEGLAKMTTGWSIAGFSFGGMAEGAAKLVGVGISLTTQAMNMALENAGKLVDNYNQLSKVGVTFGGDIAAMQKSALLGGLALDSYTKFVTKNIESLSSFGGSTQQAADNIMKLSKFARENNDKLVVMYGGFEALSDAAVGYVDLIAKTGYDVSKNVNSLNAGAVSYLINMKELSALTGQSADAIKKEQEARMKSSSYQLALSKLSAEEQTAARNKVSLVTEKYGKEAGELLEEMIAGNGTVISESGLQLQAMLGPIAQSIQDIYKVGYSEDYSKRTAEVMTSYADVIGEFAKKNQDLMFLNYGVQDQTLAQMNSVLSRTLQTLNSQREMAAAQVEIAKEADKPRTKEAISLNNVIESLNDLKISIDTKTIKSFDKMAEVTSNLIGVVDDLYNLLTPENMGDAMARFTEAVREATRALRGMVGGSPSAESAPTAAPKMSGATVVGGASGEGDAGAIMEAAASVGKKLKFKNEKEATGGGPTSDRIANALALLQEKYPDLTINAIDDLAHRDPSDKAYNKNSKHIGGRAADINLPANANLSDIQQTLAALKIKAELHKNSSGTGSHVHMEEYAKGGITNGASIAGEAGPEAVIPLPDGRTIPVRMDMSEMVSKLEEMVTLLRDQRDNSEKMLYAVQ